MITNKDASRWSPEGSSPLLPPPARPGLRPQGQLCLTHSRALAQDKLDGGGVRDKVGEEGKGRGELEEQGSEWGEELGRKVRWANPAHACVSTVPTASPSSPHSTG